MQCIILMLTILSVSIKNSKISSCTFKGLGSGRFKFFSSIVMCILLEITFENMCTRIGFLFWTDIILYNMYCQLFCFCSILYLESFLYWLTYTNFVKRFTINKDLYMVCSVSKLFVKCVPLLLNSLLLLSHITNYWLGNTIGYHYWGTVQMWWASVLVNLIVPYHLYFWLNF